MDNDRLRDWQRRVWGQRSAAVEIRLWAKEVRARSRQLCAQTRRQQHLAWCMAVANSLTVRLATRVSHHDFPRGSDMQQKDPVYQESVPTDRRDSLPPPGDRFTPSPLGHTAMAFLKWSLARNQLRRRVYRARHLRVCIDGEERWQFDPRVGLREPFSVPLSASYLEIYGDDDQGDLLLAVFPLSEPPWVEADGAQHLLMTLEGGQTVAMEIALGYGTFGEVSEYVIQLSYSEAAEVDTRGAEPPAVEAMPAAPRPETSTPWNPRISASRGPNDHV